VFFPRRTAVLYSLPNDITMVRAKDKNSIFECNTFSLVAVYHVLEEKTASTIRFNLLVRESYSQQKGTSRNQLLPDYTALSKKIVTIATASNQSENKDICFHMYETFRAFVIVITQFLVTITTNSRTSFKKVNYLASH
jgi:hypothetical protein